VTVWGTRGTAPSLSVPSTSTRADARALGTFTTARRPPTNPDSPSSRKNEPNTHTHTVPSARTLHSALTPQPRERACRARSPADLVSSSSMRSIERGSIAVRVLTGPPSGIAWSIECRTLATSSEEACSVASPFSSLCRTSAKRLHRMCDQGAGRCHFRSTRKAGATTYLHPQPSAPPGVVTGTPRRACLAIYAESQAVEAFTNFR
jgi:hypothetical protein